MVVKVRHTLDPNMQRVAALDIAAYLRDRKTTDVAPGEPSSSPRCRELAGPAPETLDAIGGATTGISDALPFPAFVWFAHLDEGPELKELAAVLLVDAMDVESKAALGQCTDAANARMGVGVSRDPSVFGADAVLREEADGAVDDFTVQIRPWSPASASICQWDQATVANVSSQ